MNHDLKLLIILLIAVIGLVILIARFKLNAFVALLCASLFVGLFSGADLPAVVKAIADGIGGVLGSIAVIIGLGTIQGKMLAESRGADVVAAALVKCLGEQRLRWTMMLVGFVVGIAVWFSVGLILIAINLARRTNTPLLLSVIPLLAGLSVMHGLVPPHPGPMVAIGLLGADTGKTILWSLLIGLPTAVIAGPMFAKFVATRVPVAFGGVAGEPNLKLSESSAPGLALTSFSIVLPVVLMLGATVVDMSIEQFEPHRPSLSDQGRVVSLKVLSGLTAIRPWSSFVGSPTVAMLISVLFAFYSLGYLRGFNRAQISRLSEECLAPVAMILLVVGAGGGFSKVLDVCGVGQVIASAGGKLSIPPLLLGWLTAALIRITVGSATVSISMAAGLLAPALIHDTSVNRELLVLAMGAGSLICSHVNDGGFWIVKEYFGFSVIQTLKTWTVMETIISVVAFALILLGNAMV
jgi:GntP family gluconate:H+ symporter